MNNNDLQTLIVQLLRKLDETNERLESLADREEQRQSEEENYLSAIRRAIQNDTIIG